MIHNHIGSNELSDFSFLSGLGPWIKKKIKEKGITQTKLASILLRTNPQVSNWLKGKEPIPHEVTFEIAEDILCLNPNEVRSLCLYGICEEFLRKMKHEINLFSELVSIDNEKVYESFIRLIEKIICQLPLSSPIIQSQILLSYIKDGIKAIRWVRRTFNDKTYLPLVHDDNAIAHLKHPMNIFVGYLLDIEKFADFSFEEVNKIQDLRRILLSDLITTAEVNAKNSTMKYIAKQHAIHMLARHEENYEYVEEMIRSSDIFMKRTAYYGTVIGYRDQETINRFIYELSNDEKFLHATVIFDAVHYNDVQVDVLGNFPSDFDDCENSILHIIRHLETDKNPGMNDISILKLVHILNIKGVKPFVNHDLVVRIKRIIEEYNNKIRISYNNDIKEIFINSFGSLLE